MASEQNEELWQQASPLLLPSAAATQSLGALVAQAALGFPRPFRSTKISPSQPQPRLHFRLGHSSRR
jgi:hypothetical protein